ncbi:hypothetical protein MAUB1S_02805 [Mycolicibacterium aubagnense]
MLNLDDYNALVVSAPPALTLPATETGPQEVVTINPADVVRHDLPDDKSVK